jgi:hypothetical protein
LMLEGVTDAVTDGQPMMAFHTSAICVPNLSNDM